MDIRINNEAIDDAEIELLGIDERRRAWKEVERLAQFKGDPKKALVARIRISALGEEMMTVVGSVVS